MSAIDDLHEWFEQLENTEEDGPGQQRIYEQCLFFRAIAGLDREIQRHATDLVNAAEVLKLKLDEFDKRVTRVEHYFNLLYGDAWRKLHDEPRPTVTDAMVKVACHVLNTWDMRENHEEAMRAALEAALEARDDDG